MTTLGGGMIVTASNNMIFTNSLIGDMLIFSNSNSQRLLIGNNSNNTANLVLTSNNSCFMSGNVGIGTTNPAYPIHVVSSVFPYIGISATNAGVNANFCLNNVYSTSVTYQTSNNYQISTGPAGNGTQFTSLVISASTGYVGVSTLSPQHALDVNGNIRAGPAVIGSNAYGPNYAVFCHSNLLSTSSSYGILHDTFGNIFINSSSSNTIYFRNNNAQLATLNNSGVFAANSLQAGNCSYGGDRINFSPQNFYILDAPSSIGVYLYNGTTSWSAQSDERLKTIIEPISDSLNKISSLRNVIFRYNRDDSNIRRVGVIAQDVQAVLPEAVNEAPDIDNSSETYLGVQYSELIPLALAGIQDLLKKVEQLEQQIASK